MLPSRALPGRAPAANERLWMRLKAPGQVQQVQSMKESYWRCWKFEAFRRQATQATCRAPTLPPPRPCCSGLLQQAGQEGRHSRVFSGLGSCGVSKVGFGRHSHFLMESGSLLWMFKQPSKPLWARPALSGGLPSLSVTDLFSNNFERGT